jgi:hypothetical protein
MPNPKRLQKLRELESRWNELNEHLITLQKDFDRETRSEERIRLQCLINDKAVAQKALENELRTLENEEKLEILRSEFFTFKRNRAYPQALDAARMIQKITPDDPDIVSDIRTLQDRIEHRERATKALGQLMAHIGELGMPFYQKIARILHPQNPQDDIVSLLLPPTEQFLAGTFGAQQYVELCDMLLVSPIDDPHTNPKVDYVALARTILAGDIVLFLGSDIPHLYDDRCWGERELAHKLATAIDYKNFEGNLSSIAELYQLRLEYGQKSLINTLNQSLPHNPQLFTLYHSLAQTPQHLILISSAYDNLLEQAFRLAGKPFVELSSIIRRTKNYDVGHVVVNFSDKEEGETIYPQEELSKLNLLEKYSLIYKMRGTCSFPDKQRTARTDALTLSETNYFTFAENANKIIPDFLAGHLNERAFLFIGFTPRSWEDRLLARILLEKRRHSNHPCYTLGEPDDPLQLAYWKKQKVEFSNIDFKELDAHLQGAAA